jgi:curved DNA-binding protein CbpA
MPDPFETLGLPPKFDLAPSDLRAAYLARVSRLHPDATGTDDQAARINDAKKILEDPESRARALLARFEGAATPADPGALPDGFLMEILEIREAMESASDPARFQELAESRRAAHIARVSELFAAADQPSDARLAEIREELNAWRYTERMIEQIDAS